MNRFVEISWAIGLARAGVLAMILLVPQLIAIPLDRPLLRALHHPDYDRWWLHDIFWYAGRMEPWIVVVVAALVVAAFRKRLRRARDWMMNGLGLLIVCGAAGLAAELLKRVVGRGRPIVNVPLDDPTFGETPFRLPLTAFVNDSNLGWPSSHAAVAAAAAVSVVVLWRPAWPVVLLLAVACCYQRLASSAHVLSDVVAGVSIGVVAGLVIWPGLAREGRGRTMPASS